MKGTNFAYIRLRYLPHSYLSNSLPFPNSAMLFGHDCQTTWQNMEMDAEQCINVHTYEGYDIYVSGTKNYFLICKSIP
jgi:hypothetical protein